ncbi:MAG: DUF1456 family protein [Spirochaetes bacterium]|nr:DUF1456 family protein [Spirochaetota bacterium]
MMTNDILRRLRFAVKMSDPAMLEMIGLGGSSASREELGSYFLKEDEAGYAECPKAVLSALLDGMIVKRRGPRADGAPAPAPAALDNNMVLKKIRIALELKEEDMIAVMRLAGADLSKNELSALFRKKGQKNYMECMDQFLRNFLSGLARFGKA